MDTLVSVVVTCYNHENYIEQCLLSIFRQTYQNIELYVFNDGSVDDSDRIIQQTLQLSPFEHTEYIAHENKGLVRTRNQAFDRIKGSCLLFVDSDNFLPENYIAELLSVMEKENADIVYTRLINPDDGQIVIEAQPFDLEHLYVENFIDSCSLIRTSVIGEIRYDLFLNHKKLEDYDFFLNLIVNHNAKAVPCFTTYLNYRVLASSMSARGQLDKYYIPYSYILKKYYQRNPEIAGQAMSINFLRLFDLMNVNCYRNEQVKIYFSKNKEFTEQQVIQKEFSSKNQLQFNIPDEVNYLRIDLTELPSYYKKIELLNVTEQQLIQPVGMNGLRLREGYLFIKPDPQIVYDISTRSGNLYELKYEHIYLDSSADYQVLVHFLNDIEITSEEAVRYLLDYKNMVAENERYKMEIETITEQYNSVIGSKRWRIPTKIINFFRRK